MYLKSFFLAALALAALAVPAAAQQSPEALIKALYAPYIADQPSEGMRPFLSEATAAEWDALYEADGYGLGFDPVVDGQDYGLSGLTVGKPVAEEGMTEVLVRFENFGEPRRMVYVLVEEPQGWKVENIKTLHGTRTWSLKALIEDAMMWIEMGEG